MPSRNVLLYGREDALPESVALRAGPCRVIFQDGDLRYLSVGDKEVVRRIYTAVRDRNWGTVPGVLSDLKIERGERSFRITYASEHKQGGIHFRWRTEIVGSEAGQIAFTADGEALSTFQRNRIGICVLHPTRECAGADARVEHSDGKTEAARFPERVAPHQPFVDMRAISHQVAPGLTAEVRFEGDVFEMEDQRNWTDGSFKTYSTPLALPFPVEVKQGTKVRQSVRVTLAGQAPATPAGDARIRLTRATGRLVIAMPLIGVGRSSQVGELSRRQQDLLRRLSLSHLRVDLDLGVAEFPVRLMAAAAEARALDTSLEIALRLPAKPEGELAKLAAHLKANRVAIARWFVFHSGQKSTRAATLQLARTHLAAVTPKAQFVTGTDAYFTELNRERPEGGADGVVFSANPQVHAFDNDSLVENLAAQTDVVESARAFATGLPVFVSPVTFRPRFNPNATGPEAAPAPGELPFAVDPRQVSLFGAVWTIASLKYLAYGGAAGITYYETAGWRGLLAAENTSQTPEPFRGLPGVAFPVYFALESLSGFHGGEVVPVDSSAPREVECLVVRQKNRTQALVANLAASEKKVLLQVPELGRRVQIRKLDLTNVEAAMRNPASWRKTGATPLETKGAEFELTLPPYALVALE